MIITRAHSGLDRPPPTYAGDAARCASCGGPRRVDVRPPGHCCHGAPTCAGLSGDNRFGLGLGGAWRDRQSRVRTNRARTDGPAAPLAGAGADCAGFAADPRARHICPDAPSRPGPDAGRTKVAVRRHRMRHCWRTGSSYVARPRHHMWASSASASGGRTIWTGLWRASPKSMRIARKMIERPFPRNWVWPRMTKDDCVLHRNNFGPQPGEHTA